MSRTLHSPADFRVANAPENWRYHCRKYCLADRPVHIVVSSRQELTSGCSAPTPVEPDGFASEFTIELTNMCAGTSLSIQIHITDEDGNEYDFDRGYWYTVPSISAKLAAQLQFLGGPDVPAYGYVYQMDMTVEGQTRRRIGSSRRGCTAGARATRSGRPQPSVPVVSGSRRTCRPPNSTIGSMSTSRRRARPRAVAVDEADSATSCSKAASRRSSTSPRGYSYSRQHRVRPCRCASRSSVRARG